MNEAEEWSGQAAAIIREIMSLLPISVPFPELPEPDDAARITPFYPIGDPGCWKQAAMYVCYGDPAFTPYTDNPGEGIYNPWI